MGGMLSARFDLKMQTGAGSLLADATLRPEGVDVSSHGRLIVEGVRVFPSPQEPSMATGLWSEGAYQTIAEVCGRRDHEWIIDLGRGDVAAQSLTKVCDVVVVVTSGAPDHIVRLRDYVDREGTARSVVVVAGPCGWSPDEVSDYCGGAHVVGFPAIDGRPEMVRSLGSGTNLVRGRSKLWRAARELVPVVEKWRPEQVVQR